MDLSSSDKQLPIIPPGEFRCVWMNAGILSYQLCDREFDCEDCPLDTALRNQFPHKAPEHIRQQYQLAKTPTEKKLNSNFLYSRNHCWIEMLSDYSARFGIEPYLAAALTIPKDLIFLAADQPVKKKQSCFWIITENGTLSIESPLDGTILAANFSLASNPHELCAYPMETGWLYELTTETNLLAEKEFMNSEKAIAQYLNDERRFKNLLSAALEQDHKSVGYTMADGGQPLQSISDVLGSKKYFSIVQQVFGLKSSSKK